MYVYMYTYTYIYIYIYIYVFVVIVYYNSGPARPAGPTPGSCRAPRGRSPSPSSYISIGK